jgi:hypothetical protein
MDYSRVDYRWKGKAVAPEDVVNYLEGATTKAL